MLLLIINKKKELKAMTAIQYYAINLTNLSKLVQDILKAQPTRMAIKLLIKNLNFDIKDASLNHILGLAAQVQQRCRCLHKKDRSQLHFNRWIMGEQKLFCSILPYYCYLRQLTLEKLNETDLRPLQSIFICKSSIQLYFEIKYLDSLSNNFKIQWNQQDSKNLPEIVAECNQQQQGIMKWKKVALMLLIRNSGTNFHSPRDCRQMWTNHLNPKVSKNSWDVRQDFELFSHIKEFGCKWSLISKKMRNMRTEHMVKNRVNSYTRKYKFKSKHLTTPQLNLIMRDLEQQATLEQNVQKKEQMDSNMVILKEQLNQEQYFFSIKQQEKKNEKDLSIKQIYDVLDLSGQGIIITSHSIEQSWQYHQDESVHYFHLYDRAEENRSTIFDELLMPNLEKFTVEQKMEFF